MVIGCSFLSLSLIRCRHCATLSHLILTNFSNRYNYCPRLIGQETESQRSDLSVFTEIGAEPRFRSESVLPQRPGCSSRRMEQNQCLRT